MKGLGCWSTKTHTQLLVAIAGGTLAYTIYTAIFRLFFHSLAKIPGPKLAALTSLYEAYYDLWLPGKCPFKIKALHEIYGPIIRPVPEEVHINDPDFLDTIYALRGRNNPNHPGLMIERSVAGAEDFYLHEMRRDALNPFFNMKFVLQMEDVIGQKCDRAMELTGVKFTKSFGWFVDLVLSFVPAGLRRNAVPSAVLDLIQFKTQAGKDIEAVFAD
ncbi:putative cytochrome P450 superfamily [Septoria linicola]|nr:putative cytochrome P450 superfamily [Septoria linicola]